MIEDHVEKLTQMKERIDSLEKEALLLKSLGNGVPAIEKNVQTVLDAVHCLKFGVSDVVDAWHARSDSKQDR